MTRRKHIKAQERKEANKTQYFAVLRNCPTSPRKMRLVADMIRGVEVNKATDMLKFSSKEAAGRMRTLLMSAISNWEYKNSESGERLEDVELVVKSVTVDSGRILKRLRPAPQGRAHRIRKRSNHVTIYIGKKESVGTSEIITEENK
ncbi:MAG: 50S ribosomal protein L22 [Bacteroidales bacterium]